MDSRARGTEPLSKLTPSKLLSIRQTLEILSIGRLNLLELAKAGQLPSVRIGKRVLFSLTDIEQFIAACRKAGVTWPTQMERAARWRPAALKVMVSKDTVTLCQASENRKFPMRNSAAKA